jgi:hypothetical protein
MAAPHVTAVAAQLCDKYSFLRYRPYTLGAVLMASALTKGEQLLSGPSTDATHHMNVYGTGRVEAYRASGPNGQQSLYFWAFSQGSSGYQQFEIPVDPGATRLTVVMYYHETAASAGAGSALVNDLDLWIDREPYSAGGASGEFFAQQSTRDNTEIRMIQSPQAANYRIKVVPDGVTSSSRVGVCAIVSYGDTSPETTLDLDADDSYVQPNEPVEITATVFNPAHVASAVHLTTNTIGFPFGDEPDAAIVTLMNGIQSDLTANLADGEEVTLGNIGHNRSRSIDWTTSWGSEGVKNFQVTMRGDNISNSGSSENVQITVDGTPPAGPTGLTSTTHAAGVPDCESDVTMRWFSATDNLSGVQGYSYVWTAFAGTIPNTSIELGAGATSLMTELDNGSWWFHIRAVDRSGNAGPPQHFGPVVVQAPDHHIYCTSTPNSTGLPGAIWFQGGLSLAGTDLVLRGSNIPAGQSALFFFGPNEVQLPFGNGFRCVGGSVVRFPIINTGAGDPAYAVDNQNLPNGATWVPGVPVKFQLWFRDPLAGGAFFDYTNGLSLQFCP